ncbi:unnamed protein product [Allacma fusca]|uniref:Uncharacterized protein n=1 Tax=Allacma fusca TaxID=39272 RepID=A0A8J2KW55_9HEXA|nr:unnamed protein product [Allacma fusca]
MLSVCHTRGAPLSNVQDSLTPTDPTIQTPDSHSIWVSLFPDVLVDYGSNYSPTPIPPCKSRSYGDNSRSNSVFHTNVFPRAGSLGRNSGIRGRWEIGESGEKERESRGKEEDRRKKGNWRKWRKWRKDLE